MTDVVQLTAGRAFLLEDVVAEPHALVADTDARTTDELLDVLLSLAAEGAPV
jgi:hypothetical protein